MTDLIAVLHSPRRREILRLCWDTETTAGAIHEALPDVTFGAVSQHLKVLRDSGFVMVRAEGTRRLYTVDITPLREVDHWLDRFRRFWDQRLDALATELARGRRTRRPRPATTKESE